MKTFPKATSFDQSFRLWKEGYRFGSNQFRKLDTDVFTTRLMMKPVVYARGAEAARMFYTPNRFTRVGAMPPSTLRLLQDKGSVQQKDGEAHHHRKALFMGMMGSDALTHMGDQFLESWRQKLPKWRNASSLNFHDEIQRILCASTADWIGTPLEDHEVGPRTEECAAMIGQSGQFGPRMWRALRLRRRTERWACEHLERIRRGDGTAPPESPAVKIAEHRTPDGELLPLEVAAVELINLLRPTVAVARYLTFLALAIHEHPEAVPTGAHGEDERRVTAFVEEVRRLYPFFPLVGGIVREAFEWRGETFAAGTWMILDLYGTHRDARSWEKPERFRPGRFLEAKPEEGALVPQGGGDYFLGHRCAGEWLTLELMKRTFVFLTNELHYEVPPQDLSINLRKLPTLPKSGFRIRCR